MASFPGIVSAVGALGIGLSGFALALWVLRFIPKDKPSPEALTFPQPVPSAPPQPKFDQNARWLLIGIVGCLGVVIFGDPGIGLFLLLVIVALGMSLRLGPGLIRKQKSKNKLKKIMEIFPQSLGMMIQALKAGQTMQQVLEYLSQECPEPLKGEYFQVCRDISLGAAAEKALGFMADRYSDFDNLRQFIESYSISRVTGANLTRLLEVLLENIQEKDRLLRKRDAMTAQARLSGLLMGCLPFLLGLVFFVMDPNLMLPLFTRPQGWAILFIAAILESIGFLWIRQLLALEF